jgi:hypothetical protein
LGVPCDYLEDIMAVVNTVGFLEVYLKGEALLVLGDIITY